jgi:hypothetical protein
LPRGRVHGAHRSRCPTCTRARSRGPGCYAAGSAAAPKRPVTRFRDIVRSELIKFRSTRPGPLIVAGSLVASAGTALLFANSTAQRYPDLDTDQQRSSDPTNTTLRGRTPSYTVPDRDRLLAAKALTTAGISLGTGLAASTSAFLAGQALLARRGVPHDTLRSPGSARAVLGGGLHATAAALLGLGIGVHTPSTAGAVSTIFGAEWLVPGIGPAFPKPLPDLITKYWLTAACIPVKDATDVNQSLPNGLRRSSSAQTT